MASSSFYDDKTDTVGQGADDAPDFDDDLNDPLVSRIRMIVAEEAVSAPAAAAPAHPGTPQAAQPVRSPAIDQASGRLVLGDMARVEPAGAGQGTDPLGGGPQAARLSGDVEDAIAAAVGRAVEQMLGPDLDARIRRIARTELMQILTEYSDI